MNVVSTSPSSTEILYALGVEPVAVSHACDYPAAAADQPTIDETAVTADASGDRHAQVEAANGDVYSIDLDVLRSVDPDLVVSQRVCGVCAVDASRIDRALGNAGVDADVVGLQANRFDDLFDCIRDVADAIGRSARADELVDDLRERVHSVQERAAGAEDQPRVAVVEWMDPVITAGNWVPDLVDAAGGAYKLAEPGERTGRPSWSEFCEYAPEIVVVAPCGYSVERTQKQYDELTDRDGWRDLPAVENGRVYAMEGTSYLNRWTPRLVDALERLAHIIHPDVFGDPPDDVVALE